MDGAFYPFILLLASFATTAAAILLSQRVTAKERLDPIFLHCDVTNLGPEDELVSATWCYMNFHHGGCGEIFSIDLTNDQPAYFFASAWAGRGQHDPASMADILLPSHYVTRNYAGTYRCTVTTTMTTSAYADVHVDVFYGPGTSIRIEPSGRVQISEGQEVTLTCLAQCRPSCNFRWYVGGRRIASTAILQVTSLQRHEGGLYACQARNEAGRSIKPVEVKVRFPASILSINVSTSGAGGVLGDDVVPRKDISLTCKVQGWPAAKVTWLKGAMPITTGNGSHFVTSSTRQQKFLVFKLSMTSMTCLHNDFYSCRVWNGVGANQTRGLPVNMSCGPYEIRSKVPPCLDPGSFGASTEDNDNGHIELERKWGQRVIFRICFWAFPMPKVYFRRRHARISYEAEVTCLNTTHACNSSISFVITSQDQYGAYEVEITNGLRSLIKKLKLVSRQPPRPPRISKVDDVTSASACLQWRPGFNGGAVQSGKLSLTRLNESGYNFDNSTDDLEKIVNVLMKDEEENSGLQNQTVCVRNLKPASVYSASMWSYNQFGQSDRSLRVQFTTLAALTSSTTSTFTTPSTSFIMGTPKTDAFWESYQMATKSSGQQEDRAGNLNPFSQKTTESILDILYDMASDLDSVHSNNGGKEYEPDSTKSHGEDDLEDSFTVWEETDDDDTEDNYYLIHSVFLYLKTLFRNISSTTGTRDGQDEPQKVFWSQPVQADRYKYLSVDEETFPNITQVDITILNSIPTKSVFFSTDTIWPPTDEQPAGNITSKGKTILSLSRTTLITGVTVISLVAVVGILLLSLIVRRRRYNGNRSAVKNTVKKRHSTSIPTCSCMSDQRNNSSTTSALGVSHRHETANHVPDPDLETYSNNAVNTNVVGSRGVLYENKNKTALRTRGDARCVCSHFRARLSTPDMNQVQSKRKRVPPPDPPPLPFQEMRRLGIPAISLNDMKLSSASAVQDSSGNCVTEMAPHVSDITEIHRLSSPLATIALGGSLNSSYASVRNGTNSNSHSYLDLYEMISTRSQSRSPSNIYNPLECSTLKSERANEGQTGEESPSQFINFTARSKEALAGRTLLKDPKFGRKGVSVSVDSTNVTLESDDLDSDASSASIDYEEYLPPGPESGVKQPQVKMTQEPVEFTPSGETYETPESHPINIQQQQHQQAQEQQEQEQKQEQEQYQEHPPGLVNTDRTQSISECCYSNVFRRDTLSKQSPVIDKKFPQVPGQLYLDQKKEPAVTYSISTPTHKNSGTSENEGENDTNYGNYNNELSSPKLGIGTNRDKTTDASYITPRSPNTPTITFTTSTISAIPTPSVANATGGHDKSFEYRDGNTSPPGNAMKTDGYESPPPLLAKTPHPCSHSPLVIRLSNKSSDDSNANHQLPIRVILDQERTDGPGLVVSGFTHSHQILELSRKVSDSEHYVDIDAYSKNGRRKTADDLSKSHGFDIEDSERLKPEQEAQFPRESISADYAEIKNGSYCNIKYGSYHGNGVKAKVNNYGYEEVTSFQFKDNG